MNIFKKYFTALFTLLLGNMYNAEGVIVLSFVLATTFFSSTLLINHFNTKIAFVFFGISILIYGCFRIFKNTK